MKPDGKLREFINSKDIGQAVKRRRNALGMSQEKLAKLWSVPYQQVQCYENGSNKLNVENIQNVAAALEVPAAFFLKPDNLLVADTDTPYFDLDELQLFKLFHTLREPAVRTLLIAVARLAARNN